MSSAPTLHIEAFEWNVSNHKFFVLGDMEDAIKIFYKVQQDQLFRGRKVLVIMGQDSMKTLTKLKLYQQQWDLVIRIRTNVDYSILGAYLQNAQKPISILWLGGDVPTVLFTKFTSGIHWIVYTGNLPASRDMNHVFISPSLPPFKYKDWFLSQFPQAHTYFAALDDLREKKAGIVYCSSDSSIKWYDSTALESGEDIALKDIRDVLIWSTEQLGHLEN